MCELDTEVTYQAPMISFHQIDIENFVHNYLVEVKVKSKGLKEIASCFSSRSIFITTSVTLILLSFIEKMVEMKMPL